MTSGVYVSVIEDVISKVRQEFMDGPGQDLLMQLQATWEAKMMQAGVIDRPAVDLNVLVFPPSRLQAPIQPPLQGTGDNLYNKISSGPCMQLPYPWMASHQYKDGGGFIPQQDGAGEFFKIEVSGGSSSSTSVVEEDAEPPLNADDDDDDLDGVEEEEELNTRNLVLAQFDKVKRTKCKWKCTLKDGIMHMNNRDILFNKATGDFDF
ncbi:hypothetical protein M0R45_014564 [Rubus argutus]|uniref:Uncharacterized protein n=1 Tax=Rubus argutus TaxID=59490 RepID=A0AAW1XN93_RUBAR